MDRALVADGSVGRARGLVGARRFVNERGVLVGLVLGALAGALNGLLVTQLRVVPFIVTLGTMLLVRGAAKGLADERRVEAPITWLNDLLRTAQDGRGWLLPSGIWLTAALAVVVAFTL